MLGLSSKLDATDKTEPWDVRHARISASLHTSELMAAVSPLAVYTARHAAFVRVLLSQLRHRLREECRMGHELDCALALLWSTPGSQTAISPSPSRVLSIERVRGRARARLDDVLRASLHPGDFSSQCTLQHGATGMVEIVRCRLDRKLYVLKSTLKGVARREAYRFSPVYESQLLAEGHSSSDDIIWTPRLHAAFQSARSLHLLMEYFPAGDLDSLLQAAAQAGPGYPGKSERGLLQEAWVVRYAVDMVSAVGWLHSLHFVHRDIKPSNFLLDKSGRLKLCDFATCAPYAYFHELGERRVLAYYTQRPAGTCDYIAPEILLCEQTRIQREWPSPTDNSASPSSRSGEWQPDTMIPGGYGPAVDWWSLGVVLYEMLFGTLPFWASQAADVYERITHHEDYFSMSEDVPCSPELASLIRVFICTEEHRLGRRCTADVQAHRVFHNVAWDNVTELPPPFVPELQQDPDVQMSILHSPAGVGWDSLTMDTPPSFSAMFQGPLDQFPAFDSLEGQSIDASWGADLHIPSPMPPTSPTPPTPSQLPTSSSPVPPASPSEGVPGPPPSPLSMSACTDIDTHFCAFSFVPNPDAFHAPLPKPVASPPAASTPFGKSKPTPLTPAIALSPDASSSLQRTALERAYLTRQDMHTPFRPANEQASMLAAPPHSPYPFPPPPRMKQTPRTPAAVMADTMGADSRHSGGSTWKRNVSERQAWSELMRAVERSARKPSMQRPTSLRHVFDEESPTSIPSPLAPPVALSSPPTAPPSSSSSSSHLGPNQTSASAGIALGPALGANAGPGPLHRPPPFSSPDSNASSSDSSPSSQILRSHSSLMDARRASCDDTRGDLRHKRSTRQLLLDAQVTSTPTRAARSMSLMPVGSMNEASPPRGHTLRTLRGSASVRDFRTEYMRLEEDNYVLPTPSAPAKESVAAPTRTSMDSHRMLSEYRRAPRTLRNESEDAFGRRTCLSKRPPITRRMQSTLGLSGLYRQGRQGMASVPESSTAPPPPWSSMRDTFQRLHNEQSHIEKHVSGLEKDLGNLRNRVDKMSL